MTSEFLISLIVPAAFVLMWTVERASPARPYVPVPRWNAIGWTFFGVVLVIGSAVPIVLARLGVTSVHLFDLSGAGWWGYPFGIVVASGANTAWHRLVHASDFLWRTTHQLHHSARRVDVAGAFFTHPLEVVAKTTIGLLVSVVALGLSPVVASAVASSLAVLSIFQHWNVHTPRWMGWIIPRPEMHALHHEFNAHRRNYSDLPFWDLLCGTFENPHTFTGEVGFEPKAAERIGDMLLMRDVNRSAE